MKAWVRECLRTGVLPTETPKKPRRSATCSACGGPYHNRATCDTYAPSGALDRPRELTPQLRKEAKMETERWKIESGWYFRQG